MRQEYGVSRRLTLYRSEVAHWAIYSPVCTFILAPHVSHETSLSLYPSFINLKKKNTQNGLQWKAGHLRVLHARAYLFHPNQRMLGWRRSKGTAKPSNRTLRERCTTDSSCSTYRVGKVQSIFSLPVNKNYSVIPLFRIPRITDSLMCGYILSFEDQ